MTDRSMTIIGVLMVSIAIGWLLYGVYLQPEVNNERVAPEAQKNEPRRISRVKATVRDCTRIGHRTRILGTVRNTGNVTLSLVTVQSLWKNDAGLIIGTGVVFVVNRMNPLAPGDSRDFEDVTRLSNVRKCNVEPLDWGA